MPKVTEYRDDLRAARMRIETLEAKLAERDAALRAREAELAERHAEFAAMRKRPGSPIDPSSRRVWLLLLSHVLVSAAAAGTGVALVRSGAAPALAPAPAEGPVVNGRVPPPAPPQPIATAVGQAQGSGDADLSTALELGLEDVRHKVKLCYADERKAHPKAEGFVKAVFEVGKDGRIGHVRLAPMTQFNDPWWSKDMGACVTRLLEAVKIPIEGKGPTTAETSWFLTPSF